MREKNEDGGPAFPRQRAPLLDCPGMSLRDYFAAHAPEMPDWYESNWVAREQARAKQDSRYCMRDTIHRFSDWRWEYADAMISAREKATA